MKKFKKIATITLGTFAALMLVIVIAAVIAGPTSNEVSDKAEPSSEVSESSAQESTTTEESTTEAKTSNESRDRLQALVTDYLSPIAINMTTDFGLIGESMKDGYVDADALEAYANDMDNMTNRLNEIDTTKAIDGNDLQDPDNKLFIDTQTEGVKQDLIEVTTKTSQILRNIIAGTATQQDLDTASEITQKPDGINMTVQTIQGICDNEENWVK